MLWQVAKTLLAFCAIPIVAKCFVSNHTTEQNEQGAVSFSPLRRFCFALDLKDDPKLIAEYEKYHQDVWPEIKDSILSSGIVSMEIYRIMNRLFMIMEVDSSFSFEKKSTMDEGNPKVKEWEELMWKYQQALPIAKPGQKWMRMDKIFQLEASSGS